MASVILSPLPNSTRILRRSQARAPQPLQNEAPVERPSVRITEPAPNRTPLAAPTSIPAPISAAAPRTQVLEHPIAQHALMVLRNKHTASQEFRAACNQLLLLLTMDATRQLPLEEQTVEAVSGKLTGRVLAKPVIFLSVSRDGVSLPHHVADYIPGVQIGTVSMEPAGKSSGLEPRLRLANAPALGDAKVILFDPVASTGVTACAALNFARRSGATDLTLITFLISSQALCRVQAALPEPTVLTASIDSDWDATRGPMPGFGSFAARLYD